MQLCAEELLQSLVIAWASFQHTPMRPPGRWGRKTIPPQTSTGWRLVWYVAAWSSALSRPDNSSCCTKCPYLADTHVRISRGHEIGSSAEGLACMRAATQEAIGEYTEME